MHARGTPRDELKESGQVTAPSTVGLKKVCRPGLRWSGCAARIVIARDSWRCTRIVRRQYVITLLRTQLWDAAHHLDCCESATIKIWTGTALRIQLGFRPLPARPIRAPGWRGLLTVIARDPLAATTPLARVG